MIEPLSRRHHGFVDILQVGRNDHAGYFYYVMELADSQDGDETAGDAEVAVEPRVVQDAPVHLDGELFPSDRGTVGCRLHARSGVLPFREIPAWQRVESP